LVLYVLFFKSGKACFVGGTALKKHVKTRLDTPKHGEKHHAISCGKGSPMKPIAKEKTVFLCASVARHGLGGGGCAKKIIFSLLSHFNMVFCHRKRRPSARSLTFCEGKMGKIAIGPASWPRRCAPRRRGPAIRRALFSHPVHPIFSA